MKKYILLFVVMFFAFDSFSAENVIANAEKAYNADQFIEAAKLYEQAKEEGVSTELYYNLGNAYYKSGEMGKAVLNYERALLLDPSNSDARYNLDFVNSKLVDKLESDENIIDSFVHSIVSITNPNGWAVIAIVTFILLLISAAVYIFSGDVLLKKVGFFGGIILLLLVVFTNLIAITESRNFSNREYAVVTDDIVILSTSPRVPKSKTEEAFLLHEGAKVKIVDSVQVKIDTTSVMWFDVKADRTHRAWIKKNQLERI